MKVSGTVVILLIVLLVVILFLVGGCTLKCNNNSKEGYKRTCLQQDTCDLKRTPVDYVQKGCDGYSQYPHFLANSGHKYQPLTDAKGLAFWRGLERLEKNKLFDEFSNYYKGCGHGGVYLPNDEKTRFDLTNLGDLTTVRKLRDLEKKNGLYGPMVQTEAQPEHTSPFQPLYFGHISRIRG